ncbi:MAG: iron-siderophore ABC transporter substrate-binding protein [Prochlorothrix sp.]|nr:iron-siderophore ABC transporter substrate-binding protein [Prochlorothrix sp.]
MTDTPPPCSSQPAPGQQIQGNRGFWAKPWVTPRIQWRVPWGCKLWVGLLSLSLWFMGGGLQGCAAVTGDAGDGLNRSMAAVGEYSAVGEQAETRTVQHALGQTVVPRSPQRIVTLGNLPLEAALVLGVVPLGAAPDSFAGNPGQFPGYLPEDAVAAMTYLGDEEQPSLERIVSLQPDLILGLYPVHSSLYAQLSQIAPTVLYPVFDGKAFAPWQDALATYGEAIDRSEAVDRVLAAYNRQIQTLRQQLPQSPNRYQVSLLRFMPGQLRLYLGGSFAGRVLADVGFARPPAQRQETFFERISLEQLPEADGDRLVVLQSDPEATLFREFSQTPLWQNLGAVQADRVYSVNYDYWLSEGPIAAQKILEDLLTIFSDS